MRPTTHYLATEAARREALFASTLQPSDAPGAEQVRRAVAQTARRLGGTGCAERVAQEFGDHPETAVVRMRWARRLVDDAFGPARRFVPPAQPVPAHAARAA